ncbi:ferritin-like domain-containing protein [Corallococcus carmarthensis]|uniref:ferritin-like domain-containing protein n=1 Tax=Corallococcus carmarthensis TaxID=2316728 RepID=UPI00148D45DE|nr:ferritin-like domain-containing protein [Corallococcus carmarthensis]NOK20976.1 ferritin-like domain-containing protein [Corallococcus carmarthensis]
MSRRALRPVFKRLWLLAPVVTLGVGCSSTWGCDFDKNSGPRTFALPATLNDGGVPTQDTPCEDLCEALGATTPCSRIAKGEGGAEADMVTCEASVLCEGRRPEGLCSDGAVAAEVPPLGALFARMAHLEAASVPAFERLADELAGHGAPERLVRAARRAAKDEVRHASAMESLALLQGAPMPELKVAPFQPRSLEALAIENAVEGCVRETFGALLAGWQARSAEDAQVRESLGTIAPDELMHAELSWAIDAWAMEQLSPEARERVDAARREAWRELERNAVTSHLPDDVARLSGLPAADVARRLVRELAAELMPGALA